jgi:hypothetical protein
LDSEHLSALVFFRVGEESKVSLSARIAIRAGS